MRACVLCPLTLACPPHQHSRMVLEPRGWPLALSGPDAIALPVGERYLSR